jgi:alpha-mannosidase
MRNLYTEGSTSALFGWIISARMDVKQDNFRTERDLTSLAEPLAVFSALLGADYPQGFLDNAYNWLLQNHGHDSIGGCSREIISDDMIFRSRQAREISACVTETALKQIAGSIGIDTEKHTGAPIVAYNPAPFKRSETMQAYVQIPREWECETIEIVDANDKNIEFAIIEKEEPFYQIVQSPNDCANIFPMSRYLVDVQFDNVPAMGYKTFFAKPIEEAKQENKTSMVTGPNSMANEFLSVLINANGTLDVIDKQTGKHFKKQGYFKDSSEIGNPWEHATVVNEEVFTTINATAATTLVKDTPLEASYRVTIDWQLPEGRTKDDKSRSGHLNDYKVITTYTLRKGQPWVEAVTSIDNNCQDHYLQVCFPSQIDTDKISVQSQFDVVERSLERIDYSQFDEVVQTEHPMNSFIDLSDGEAGLALLNEGLKAYEVLGEEEKTMCLTLLRCFPLRICVTQEMTDYSDIDKSSQCLGKHSFRYAVMPHKGDWQEANLWQASERFNLTMLAAQISPTSHGAGALEKSFLELEKTSLHVSAVKKSEAGDGWCVRLFNQADKAITNKIRLNGGRANPAKVKSPVEAIKSEFALPALDRSWSVAREVTLEELAVKDMEIDSEGWVRFEIGAKQILTIEFLP